MNIVNALTILKKVTLVNLNFTFFFKLLFRKLIKALNTDKFIHKHY